MNIFIDESGSFVNAPQQGSWNCVAAYVSPEKDRKHVSAALQDLKKRVAKVPKQEIKLKDVDEVAYFDFLAQLSRLDGALFAIATDAGIQPLDEIKHHQRVQADLIAKHKDKMKHAEGRRALVQFSEQMRVIAPQLYAQLFCHVYLIFAVVSRGVLYFVQRVPYSLGVFRWRIDQKNSAKNVFEDSYLKLALPLLQTISLRTPFPMLEGADYSRFKRFDFAPGEAPTYLRDDYGIEADDGFDLGKLLRENLTFQNSQLNPGIQVVDLLASGIRRCLRGGFSDNRRAALLLGSLMVQDARDKPPIGLIGFGRGEDPEVDDPAAQAAARMKAASRAMLAT